MDLYFNEAHVTDHAKGRIKERLNIPKSSHKRHAKNVLERGTEVNENWLKYKKEEHDSDLIVRHGEFVYSFARSGNDYVMVTMFNRPEP